MNSKYYFITLMSVILSSLFIQQGAHSQQSPHGNLTIACTVCHSLDSWKMRTNASFNHNSTGFPLEGKHKLLACSSCHQQLVFKRQETNCQSCHTDIHRSELGDDCQRCHTIESWIIPDMREKHQQTRFPLLGKHSFVPCSSCHDRVSSQRFAGTPLECIACHRNEFQSTTSPNHELAKFPVDCNRCHSFSSDWETGFEHSQTGFPLTGDHQSLICSQCHADNKFSTISAECYSCHADNFSGALSPNHISGGFPTNCISCHTTVSWRPALFDHSVTQFPLTGQHSVIECQDCHLEGNYTITYSNCAQCHLTDYQQTTNPNHQSNNFSQDCQSCHTTANWQTTAFDHTTTSFLLTGAHTATPCNSCHVNNNYQVTYTNCFQCHQTDFELVTEPNHTNGGFDHTCSPCHATISWLPAMFSHETTTFPLTGRHAYTTCQQCHTNGNYDLSYSNCYQCHQTNFEQASNPNHQTSSFNQNCVTCHSTDGWSPASFEHSTTSFALTGSHVGVLCTSCHTNSNYQLIYSNCFTCHQEEYGQVVNPNHTNGIFNYTCEPCHSTTQWSPSLFNHSSTNFSLTGQHTVVLCQSCHTNGNYSLTYTNCYQCHQNDFTGVVTPNHVNGNFDHDCTPCHTTSAWSPASFNHSTTNFPLTGQHVAVTCQSCHTNGNYNLTYTNCYQCHQDDFTGVVTPNHVNGNFEHDCTPCHTTSAWNPATFNHNTTNFPLTGQHTAVTCQSCHTNGNYNLTYTNCYQCHQNDFIEVVTPNHVNGNFDHNCTPCHTTSTWSPATFNHGTTNFALTGQHVAITCQSCHTNGNYSLTYTNCYQCHQQNFQEADNPIHSGAGFTQVCNDCHTTDGWSPAQFDHTPTTFPLTGSHVATLCLSCHTENNYRITYAHCYQCHETDYNQPVSPSHSANSFSFNCQPCHSTVSWLPSTFNHSTTAFVLTGAHQSTACSSCHTGGNYQITYIDCYQCHQTDYQQPTNPNHVQATFSHDCLSCHTTSVWKPSTLNHDQQYFKIYSGKHRQEWSLCTDCHTTPSTYALFSCINCHEHTRSETDSDHREVQGYSYVSSECYRCHRNI